MTDLVHIDFSSPVHPLARKRILVMCGGDDEPVLASSNRFRDRWYMDEEHGACLKVIIQKGVEHFVTKEMLGHLAKFVWTQRLRVVPANTTRAQL